MLDALALIERTTGKSREARQGPFGGIMKAGATDTVVPTADRVIVPGTITAGDGRLRFTAVAHDPRRRVVETVDLPLDWVRLIQSNAVDGTACVELRVHVPGKEPEIQGYLVAGATSIAGILGK